MYEMVYSKQPESARQAPRLATRHELSGAAEDWIVEFIADVSRTFGAHVGAWVRGMTLQDLLDKIVETRNIALEIYRNAARQRVQGKITPDFESLMVADANSIVLEMGTQYQSLTDQMIPAPQFGSVQAVVGGTAVTVISIIIRGALTAAVVMMLLRHFERARVLKAVQDRVDQGIYTSEQGMQIYDTYLRTGIFPDIPLITKPLKAATSALTIAVWVAAIGAGLYYGWPYIKKMLPEKKPAT